MVYTNAPSLTHLSSCRITSLWFCHLTGIVSYQHKWHSYLNLFYYMSHTSKNGNILCRTFLSMVPYARYTDIQVLCTCVLSCLLGIVSCCLAWQRCQAHDWLEFHKRIWRPVFYWAVMTKSAFTNRLKIENNKVSDTKMIINISWGFDLAFSNRPERWENHWSELASAVPPVRVRNALMQ